MNERAKGYTTFMAKFQDGKTYLIWVAGGRGKESSSSEDDIGLLVLDLEAWVSFCLIGREVGRGHSGINRRRKSRRRPKRKKNVGWSCQGRSVRRICMSHRSCMSQCLKDTDRIHYVILQTRVKSKPGNVKEAQQERQQGDQSPPSSIAPLPNPQGTQSSQWALGWYAGHALGLPHTPSMLLWAEGVGMENLLPPSPGFPQAQPEWRHDTSFLIHLFSKQGSSRMSRWRETLGRDSEGAYFDLLSHTILPLQSQTLLDSTYLPHHSSSLSIKAPGRFLLRNTPSHPSPFPAIAVETELHLLLTIDIKITRAPHGIIESPRAAHFHPHLL